MALHPLKTPVQYVKGVGPWISELLSNLNIHTVKDLLYHFPHRYVDKRNILPIKQLAPGKDKCIIGEVVEGAVKRLARRKIYELFVTDKTGIAVVVFFHFNEKFLTKKYPAGKRLLISGDCQFYGNHKQFTHPDIEEWDEEGNDVQVSPVYPLTEGLHQKTLRKIIFAALDQYLNHIPETALTVRADGTAKVSVKESIEAIHRPPQSATIEELESRSSVWHQRIVYDNLFYIQLGMGLKKIGHKKQKGVLIRPDISFFHKALSIIPFELTNAQKRVLEEVELDFKKEEPMNRLLQGDVGSGKTMVAFLAAVLAISSGAQVTIMAPTEILARQHMINISSLAQKIGINVACLLGSTPNSERKIILNDLKAGKINLLLGTHALIEDDVQFQKLGLVVIDEQHRFGVLQRAKLQKKGDSNASPHILVMTATPIPRTLAMGLYGDLDVSVIDELPKGRKPIGTKVFYESQRAKAYVLIEEELKKNHQAYFIYPLVEESEKLPLKDAISMSNQIQQAFPKYKVALLHGRMNAKEKDEIMESFKQNKIQILVSTTVIEVGVDVPNATVMVVEHAERFGLSQLHQLRGRVGRGGNQSYCILIPAYSSSEETRFRLKTMEETNDGFKIAEADLKLRGPGDFLGTRQSGLPEEQLAQMIGNEKLLAAAKKRAEEILADDPLLAKEANNPLKECLNLLWSDKLELADIS